MGFLEDFGSGLPQKDVVIVRDEGTANEVRTPSRAIVQPNSGQFNVDTPIFEGDVIEVPDPRGGIQRLYAAEVRVNDVDHDPDFAGMGHINVKWGMPRVERQSAPTFHISGGSNQIAWGNQKVTQQQSIATADLRATLEALLVSAVDNIADAEDREIVEASAVEAIGAIDAGNPAPRRAVATIKGVLSDLASGIGRGAGTGVANWATDLLSNLG